MNNNNLDTEQFNDFISATMKSREVGLIIAEDTEELSNFSKLLKIKGFGELSSILKYENVEHSWYIIADNDNFKGIYDFICQYPLTTISLFDSEIANTVVMNPDYKHSVIVLIEKDILNIAKKDLDFLGRVGATYITK